MNDEVLALRTGQQALKSYALAQRQKTTIEQDGDEISPTPAYHSPDAEAQQ